MVVTGPVPEKWAGSVLGVQLWARPLSRVALSAVRTLLTERSWYAHVFAGALERSGRPIAGSGDATQRAHRRCVVADHVRHLDPGAGALRPAAERLQLHPDQG